MPRLTAMLLLPLLALTSCSPTIPDSATGGGELLTYRHGANQTRRELSGPQAVALADWINGRKGGWDACPFVNFAPCTYLVLLRDGGESTYQINICPDRVVVGAGTQYRRSTTSAEHAELLRCIGAETE